MKLTKIETPPQIRTDTAVGTRIFAGGTIIYGDTGWRNIASWLDPSVKLNSNLGKAKVRRIGDIVYFDLKLEVVAETTSILTGVPLGFRAGSDFPTDAGITTAPTPAAGASALRSYTAPGVIYAGDKPLRTGAITPLQAGITMAWTLSYTTPDPWPTSLPGNPA